LAYRRRMSDTFAAPRQSGRGCAHAGCGGGRLPSWSSFIAAAKPTHGPPALARTIPTRSCVAQAFLLVWCECWAPLRPGSPAPPAGPSGYQRAASRWPTGNGSVRTLETGLGKFQWPAAGEFFQRCLLKPPSPIPCCRTPSRAVFASVPQLADSSTSDSSTPIQHLETTIPLVMFRRLREQAKNL